MASPPFDYLVKMLLIGDSGVGKSSLLLQFADASFGESFMPTIGIDYKYRVIQVDGKRIKAQIWDTAGQERYSSITSQYYRTAQGIALVYDVTSQESFKNVSKWAANIDKYASDVNVCRILIGNKSDLEKKRVVSLEEGRELAKTFKIPFYETSAKSSQNVDEAFEQLARLIKQKIKDPGGLTREDSIDIKKGAKGRRPSGATPPASSGGAGSSSSTRYDDGDDNGKRKCC